MFATKQFPVLAELSTNCQRRVALATSPSPGSSCGRPRPWRARRSGAAAGPQVSAGSRRMRRRKIPLDQGILTLPCPLSPVKANRHTGGTRASLSGPRSPTTTSSPRRRDEPLGSFVVKSRKGADSPSRPSDGRSSSFSLSSCLDNVARRSLEHLKIVRP